MPVEKKSTIRAQLMIFQLSSHSRDRSGEGGSMLWHVAFDFTPLTMLDVSLLHAQPL